MPIAKLRRGAIIHPATIVRNGFRETNLVLYERPVPRTAEAAVCVLESGILKNVASSTRSVEVTSVAAALV